MKQQTRPIVALGAAIAMVAGVSICHAQDDLDDLLKDLENEAAEVAEVAPEAAEETVEAVAEAAEAVDEAAEAVAEVAEEPAAEEPAEEVAEVAEEPAAEEPAEEVAEVAEEPAAEEPAEEVVEVAEEPAAEEPAEEVAEVAEEPAAEEPAEEVAEVAEEPAAEEPVEEVAEVAEKPAAEEPAEEPAEEVAEAVAEPAPATPAPVNLFAKSKNEAPAETAVAEVAAVEEPAEVAAVEEPAEVAAVEPAEVAAEEEPAEVAAVEPAAAEPAATPASAAAPASPKYDAATAELIANAQATERLRRESFDLQARHEIEEARACMERQEFIDATRHFAAAKKLLNDSPSSAGYRKECDQGIAASRYFAAIQEWRIGNRVKARKFMQQAIDYHHPRARAQLEAWNKDDDPDKDKVEISEIASRRNDEDYKSDRSKIYQHLKRSRAYLGARDLDRALVECELVLVADPYNQTAIRLRNAIEQKRATILRQERKAARDGMIADVDRAWRPVYAVDAREIESTSSETLKKPLLDDPTLAMEQKIIKRMKEMRLPSISFKPPATIVDAIDFFRGASRDFDRPEIPLEQRGFNFVLKTPEPIRTAQAADGTDDEGFGGGDEEESAAQSGFPVISTITASDITFYDALKLVCESVDYKFKVQGPIVMVMHKDATTAEMVTRSYPVVSAFMERMGNASSDMKELKSQGFGGGSRRNEDEGEENQERDWKEFFSLLGVQWPEGSSIMYIKTIGKLRVRNTYENLAELEKALTEMNADPKLIEIETRFVEVCQEDLNSLGFEWILNSDYSIGVGKHIGRALGIRGGKWGTETSTRTTTVNSTDYTDVAYDQSTGMYSTYNSGTSTTTRGLTSNSTTVHGGAGNRWSRNYSGHGSGRNVGINAFGGDADYQTNMRYLSTDSNHISGQGYSKNDQFMRVNAFLGSADLSMILHMLSQRSDTDLLSAPKVLTKPGEEAVIKVVTEYIYPTDYDVQLQSSSSSSSGNSGSSQSAILAVVEPQSFTMREVGVILDVTPTLTDDGNLIDLDLNTQVVDEPTWKNYGMRIPFTGNASSLQNFTGLGEIFTGLSAIMDSLGTSLSDAAKATFAQSAMDSASSALENLTSSSQDNMTYYDAPMEQPFFHVRSIVSKVSVFPGATIVMGGLITEQRKAMDDKVPFLGDLPFIGRLFRSHSEQTSKRNLLIFVTTRLVDVRGREVAMGETDEKDEDVKPVENPED